MRYPIHTQCRASYGEYVTCDTMGVVVTRDSKPHEHAHCSTVTKSWEVIWNIMALLTAIYILILSFRCASDILQTDHRVSINESHDIDEEIYMMQCRVVNALRTSENCIKHNVHLDKVQCHPCNPAILIMKRSVQDIPHTTQQINVIRE